MSNFQEKLDNDFPNGAVVELSSGDPAEDGVKPTFVTSGFTFLYENGGEPYILFTDINRIKVFQIPVSSYDVLRTRPVKVVRVVSDGIEFTFSANISEALAERIKDIRKEDREIALRIRSQL